MAHPSDRIRDPVGSTRLICSHAYCLSASPQWLCSTTLHDLSALFARSDEPIVPFRAGVQVVASTLIRCNDFDCVCVCVCVPNEISERLSEPTHTSEIYDSSTHLSLDLHIRRQQQS